MSENEDMESPLAERWRQTKILLRKNWILIKRNRRSTLLQIIVPFLFVLLLYIFQIALTSNNERQAFLKNTPNSPTVSFGKVPRCIVGEGKKECLTLAWTSNNNTHFQPLVDDLLAKEGIPSKEARAFDSTDAMDDFMRLNPNVTQAAYVLTRDYNTTDGTPVPVYRYAVQYNQSAIVVKGTTISPFEYLLLPYQDAIERALLRFITGDSNAELNTRMREFAHPALSNTDVIATRGPSFFFGALMFNFVIQLGQIVTESENKLREGMNLMGLKDSVFWFTWWMTNTILNIISACVLVLSGWIFGFDFFVKNDFGTYFVLFILFAVSMVPLVFLISVFVSRSRTATSLGFVVYLIGTIIQGFAALAFTEEFEAFWRVVFSFLPFALLSKGISDLAAQTDDPSKTGLRWSEIADNEWFSLQDVFTWYIIDFVVFFLLAIYFDNVLQGNYGIAKPFYYFLTREYWLGPDPNNVDKADLEERTLEDEDDIDDDVRKERDLVRENKDLGPVAVRIVNLVKTFYRYKWLCIPDHDGDFTAVHGICLSIPEGQLLCLLGHNGAGKTTTISMLTGMIGPSAGTAYIFGNSINTNMDKIRQVMGVCPQHDILWDQLSGREHLEMFAAFKGLEGPQLALAVEDGLKSVGLHKKGAQDVSQYSGGEKRRLSTAIALIADPKIVFLDEPTTGMDPVSRRDVWNLIESSKRDRVIVLTTHSMEEADILGDRVVIMSRGRLSCIGNSLHLKNRFGAGYHVSILVPGENMDGVKQFMRDNLDGIEPENINIGILEYNIDRPMVPKLPELFNKLEEAKEDLGINNVQVSQSTLEEVFLSFGNHEEENKK